MIFFITNLYCTYKNNTVNNYKVSITTLDKRNEIQNTINNTNYNMSISDSYNLHTQESKVVLQKEKVIYKKSKFNLPLACKNTILNLEEIIENIRILKIKVEIFNISTNLHENDFNNSTNLHENNFNNSTNLHENDFNNSTNLHENNFNISTNLHENSFNISTNLHENSLFFNDMFIKKSLKNRISIYNKFMPLNSFLKNEFSNYKKTLQLVCKNETMLEIYNFFETFLNFVVFIHRNKTMNYMAGYYYDQYKSHLSRLILLYEDPDFSYKVILILKSLQAYLENEEKQHFCMKRLYFCLMIYLEKMFSNLTDTIEMFDSFCRLMSKEIEHTKKYLVQYSI